MTADLTILPVGGNAHAGTVVAEALKALRQLGISYQLTGTTTCLQGTWEQITAAAKLCHDICRKHTPHVVTMLRIEDDIEGGNSLQASVEAVEELAGEKFNQQPPGEPGRVAPPPTLPIVEIPAVEKQRRKPSRVPDVPLRRSGRRDP